MRETTIDLTGATPLFGRRSIVTVTSPDVPSGFRVDGLRVSFKITRDLKPQPNRSEITIYNLSKESRDKCRSKDGTVTLLAGLGSDVSQIFAGTIHIATSVRDKVDWATKLLAGDGEKAFRSSRVVESFKPGTPIVDVLNKVGASLGLNLGNLTSKLSSAKFRKEQTAFPNGISVEGQSSRVLTELLDNVAGLTWSIQDGAIQILADDDTSDQPLVLLDSSSGLIGSPELAETGQDKHTVLKVKTLLRPQLIPGARIQIDSVQFKKAYAKIEKVVHQGDTHSNPWYSELECQLLKTS